MAKVLLLGGTGAMGVYLRQELVAAGHHVVVTSRKARPAERGITYLVGNGKDIEFLRTVLAKESPEVVVDFMVYSTAEFAARVELLLADVKQYVFLSSYRVFNEQVPLREDSPRLLDSVNDPEYLKTDEYGLCKARCENILRKSGRSNWTIVRPCITYSKERFQFGCLEADAVCYRAFRNLPVAIPAEVLSRRTTMSWAGDVAKMISRLVLNSKAMGEDFNVVTAESHTWDEIAEVYRSTIGMTMKTIPLASYMGFCGKYQVRYDRMFDREMDNSKILSVTGMKQSELTPLEIGLKRELLSNREVLLSIAPNIIQNAKMDSACGIVCLPPGGLKLKLRYLSSRFGLQGLAVRVILLLKRMLAK